MFVVRLNLTLAGSIRSLIFRSRSLSHGTTKPWDCRIDKCEKDVAYITLTLYIDLQELGMAPFPQKTLGSGAYSDTLITHSGAG